MTLIHWRRKQTAKRRTGSIFFVMAAMDSAASKAFTDALYRKVLLAVKASNAVPTEDDDFHYHSKFSKAFAAHVASSGAKAEALVWQLTRVDKKRKAIGAADDSDDSDNDDNGDASDSKRQELFDGPEPKSRITDFVDALLDDASKQLELFQRGPSATAASTGLRPLENKPQTFDTNKKAKDSEHKVAVHTSSSSNRYSRGMAKPQEQFDEHIDNSDAPFVTKLREKVHALPGAADSNDADDADDDDALARQHPYFAEIRGLKYAEWQLEASADAFKQVPVEDASYLWVDSDETLAAMMASLTRTETRVVAVDLEHHSYRSYLGLVCLMQISTATEDFLVDTLALRSKLQVLNTVFCDPAKVKVLHGSDMDMLWLQRDLGLYVVNLFDTGQAARLLQYPRFSLAYLLKRHCGVEADKQYQLADWRIRPLEANMVKYAREDTRYLLYIYDVMKRELLAASDATRASLLFDALQQSNKLSLQVYVKPRVSDDDCDALCDKLRATTGLATLSPLQHRVFALLYYWRDRTARAEDESTGYVLPNQALMKLAKVAPTKSEQLFRTCNPVPPLVRKYAHDLTSQISAVKAALAAEDAKAASAAPAPAPVAKGSTHWRASDGDNEMANSVITSSSSAALSAYVEWQSGQRSAKCVASTDDAAASSGLRASFAALRAPSATPAASADGTAAAALARVNALVARTAFTVTENDTPDAPAAATAPAPAPAPVAAHADALPQSIAETYQMTNRAKRRKTESSAPDASGEIALPDAATSTAAPAFEAFDYAAASAQVAGATFDMADATRANDRNVGGKKKRGVKQAQGGYNPFVAVRGAAGSGDAPEELTGAKKAVKKMHHMPRSATFR